MRDTLTGGIPDFHVGKSKYVPAGNPLPHIQRAEYPFRGARDGKDTGIRFLLVNGYRLPRFNNGNTHAGTAKGTGRRRTDDASTNNNDVKLVHSPLYNIAARFIPRIQ